MQRSGTWRRVVHRLSQLADRAEVVAITGLSEPRIRTSEIRTRVAPCARSLPRARAVRIVVLFVAQ